MDAIKMQYLCTPIFSFQEYVYTSFDSISMWHLFAIYHLNPIVCLCDADSVRWKSPKSFFICHWIKQTKPILPYTPKTVFLCSIWMVMLIYKYRQTHICHTCFRTRTHTNTHTQSLCIISFLWTPFMPLSKYECDEISVQFIFSFPISSFFPSLVYDMRKKKMRFSKDFHSHYIYIYS